MQADQYEWDEAKAISNLQKHGVSFHEAVTIFDDPRLRLRLDEDHSAFEEERWHAIGISRKGRLLVTVIVDRYGRVRLVSARKATRREERMYDED